MSEFVYLGLGSNLGRGGDRAASLVMARKQVAALGEVDRVSSIYESAPWGVDLPQPDFLNQVLELRTELDAVQLLLTLQEIEREMGAAFMVSAIHGSLISTSCSTARPRSPP